MDWDDDLEDFAYKAEVELQLRRMKAQAEVRQILAGGNAASWDADIDVMSLTDPAPPSLFWRANANGTFTGYGYPGALHLLYGARKSGKTMLAYAFAAQELSQGRGVLWFAFERQQGVRERLALAGARDLSRLKYREASGMPSGAQVQALADAIREAGVSLVVFDAFRGLQAAVAPGTSANDGDAVELVNARILVPLQRAGAAVLVIDHTSKDGGGASAFGSERKESMADVVLSVAVLRAFDRETEGWSQVKVTADRYGYLGDDSPGYLVMTPGRGIQFRGDIPVGPAMIREDTADTAMKLEIRHLREMAVWNAVLHADDWTMNGLATYLSESVIAAGVKMGKSKWDTLLRDMIMSGAMKYAFGPRNSRLMRPGPDIPLEVRPLLADPDVAARLERYRGDAGPA